MIGTSACGTTKKANGVPKRVSIPTKYSHVEDYYKYGVRDGKATQLYNSENIYLLYDKKTYSVEEYLYYGRDILGGLGRSGELYDLETEKNVSIW